MKPMKVSSTTRASITFPPELYTALEWIARNKKVSIAWVVRDAVEKYVSGERKDSQENRSG
jgi:metal-responsive CopG/Arc/MetJ family transcriptional regulator